MLKLKVLKKLLQQKKKRKPISPKSGNLMVATEFKNNHLVSTVLDEKKYDNTWSVTSPTASRKRKKPKQPSLQKGS